MKNLSYLLICLGLAGGVSMAVVADDYGDKSERREGMMKYMGKHSMPGTVGKIDMNTGMVEVKTDAGNLMLHFPPASLKDVKAGDTITVHMSFSTAKDKEKKSGGMGY